MEAEVEANMQSTNLTVVSSELKNRILIMLKRISSKHGTTRISTIILNFARGINTRIKKAREEQLRAKVEKQQRNVYSIQPKETKPNHVTTAPTNPRSVLLQGDELYEGRRAFYSFIQRSFLPELSLTS